MNSLEKGENPEEFDSKMKEKYTIYTKHHQCK